MQATRLFTVLLVSFLFSATGSAQVFDSGPSDSALFTNVINLPGDDLPFLVGGSEGTHQVNVINGGVVNPRFLALDGSEVNISGSSVGDRFRGLNGSNVNVLGSDFALGGVMLDDLIAGEAFTILDRGDVTLSGLLADGSAFSFDLNISIHNDSAEDLFDPGSTLTITLALLGDCNLDGVVNFSDISPFVSILSAEGYLTTADINEDGVFTFLDIAPFIAILASGD